MKNLRYKRLQFITKKLDPKDWRKLKAWELADDDLEIIVRNIHTKAQISSGGKMLALPHNKELAELGRTGGARTLERHGSEHYRRIASERWKKQKHDKNTNGANRNRK